MLGHGWAVVENVEKCREMFGFSAKVFMRERQWLRELLQASRSAEKHGVSVRESAFHLLLSTFVTDE
jgi:hypothetical protein